MEFFVDRNNQPKASKNYQGTTLERTDTGSMYCLYWYYEITLPTHRSHFNKVFFRSYVFKDTREVNPAVFLVRLVFHGCDGSLKVIHQNCHEQTKRNEELEENGSSITHLSHPLVLNFFA